MENLELNEREIGSGSGSGSRNHSSRHPTRQQVHAHERVIEQQTHEAIAAQIGERPERIMRRGDLPHVLKIMQNGLLIDLKIKMPSFAAKTESEQLGVEVENAEALSVFKEYFRLGRFSLLPKERHAELLKIVQMARKALYDAAIKTRWGSFVPVNKYQKWKEDNERFQTEFLAARDRLIEEWTALVEQTIEIYRPMAESAWDAYCLRREAKLRATYPLDDSGRASAGYREGLAVLDREHVGFIESYLDSVRSQMPDEERLAESFSYEWVLERIPLPSELARDQATAENLYKEQALHDAQHRADLSLVAARQELEQDLITSTRHQAQQLADEFFNGVVSQVNKTLKDVSENVLESIEKNEGKLVGRASTQIHNLLEEMEGFQAFLGDENLNRQIEWIKSVLPQRPGELVAASTGQGSKRLKLDTEPLKRALKEVGQEAEETLLELEAVGNARSGRASNRRRLRQSQSQGQSEGQSYDQGQEGVEEEANLLLTPPDEEEEETVAGSRRSSRRNRRRLVQANPQGVAVAAQAQELGDDILV